MKNPNRQNRLQVVVTLAITTVFHCSFMLFAAAAAPFVLAATPDDAWPEVRKKIEAGHINEANALLATIGESASKNKNYPLATKAWLRQQQLRAVQGQWEKVITTFALDSRTGKDPKSKSANGTIDAATQMWIHLQFAAAIETYYNNYRYEIDKRNQIDAPQSAKEWTRDDLAKMRLQQLNFAWALRSNIADQDVESQQEFLRPNNYPPGIRDSLRDFLSYQLAIALEDTAFWTSEELHEKYKLNLKNLATDEPRAAAQTLNIEPREHPLKLLTDVLLDLEYWNSRSGRADAAMAARIRLLDVVHANLDQQKDRDHLLKWLTEYLTGNRTVSWWTMGMATLGDWYQQNQQLSDARQTFTECSQRYKASPGAKLCEHRLGELLRPTISLSAMQVDSPGKRSILLRHRNVERVHFRAWKIDVLAAMKTANRDGTFVSRKLQEQIQKTKPQFAWTTNIPATSDLHEHQTYVTPPLGKSPVGVWLIVASYREDFATEANHLVSTLFTISDLVVLKKNEQKTGEPQSSNELIAYVVRGSDGAPQSGAKVDLYRYDWSKGHRLEASTTTKPDGSVRFKTPANSDDMRFIIASRSTDKGIEITPDPEAIYFYSDVDTEIRVSHLIYTDRAVYRPGQKVHWKILGYKNIDENTADVKPAANLNVTVSLLDGNWEKVKTLKVKTNRFGTASGSFDLPLGRGLGNWTIQTNSGSLRSLRVEEYKRPTFEVALDEPQKPLRINREAIITGNAKFYFGQNLSEGIAKWRVRRAPVYPWWWDFWFTRSVSPTADQQVAAGTSKVGADGKFTISFLPEGNELDSSSDLTWNFDVTVDLTDAGGETRTASKTYRVGRQTIEASIDTVRPGQLVFFDNKIENDSALKFKIMRQTLAGSNAPGSGTWRVNKLNFPNQALMPADLPISPNATGELGSSVNSPTRQFTAGDKIAPRWSNDRSLAERIALISKADESPVASGVVRHSTEPTASPPTIDLTHLTPGVYRLTYETKDDFGTPTKAWKDFVVIGREPLKAFPLYLAAKKTIAKVGDTIDFVVGSGFNDQMVLLEVHRRTGISHREYIRIDGQAWKQLKIGTNDRGDIQVVATMVRDHQIVRQEFRVQVPWDDKKLDVRFTTIRNKLTPGSKEIWQIQVKGPEGRSLSKSAEILALMYDRSLDLWGAHSLPSLSGLFPLLQQQSPWDASLGVSQNQRWNRSGPGSTIKPPSALREDNPWYVEVYRAGYRGYGGLGRRGQFGSSGALGGAMDLAESNVENGVAADELQAPAAMDGAPHAARSAVMGVRGLATSERTANNAVAKKTAAPAQSESQGVPPEGPRSLFAETAFWFPDLICSADGTVKLNFEVPDSLTSWRVLTQAITEDLDFGETEAEVRTTKDLMVRPYLPRFLREGDQAELRIVVNNTSGQDLNGNIRIAIENPATNQNIGDLFKLSKSELPFRVARNAQSTVKIKFEAPQWLVPATIKVSAISGRLADTEINHLPIWPSRVRLQQSRFATLVNQNPLILKFEPPFTADGKLPTDLSTEQVVLQADGQLVSTMLRAIPAILTAPYESTDILIDQLVTTSILNELYKKNPIAAQIAKEHSRSRKSILEPFSPVQNSQAIAREETPWLAASQGNLTNLTTTNVEIQNLLNPQVTARLANDILKKLANLQTDSGGFSWFPGGRPSEYMTLLVLDGFAKAAEFGVNIPIPIANKAWNFLGQTLREEISATLGSKKPCCLEVGTYLNYLVTMYQNIPAASTAVPAALAEKILEQSMTNKASLSPRIKAYLMATLQARGRHDDARQILRGILDGAKTDPQLGTWWAPEDRSWLWYQDTIESHALTLRSVAALDPNNPIRAGLITWLMLNKKLNQWKSPRATAEVIYTLAKTLDLSEAQKSRESISFVAGNEAHLIQFDPGTYDAKKQIILTGKPAANAALVPWKVTKNSSTTMFASMNWFFATSTPVTQAQGDLLGVSKRVFLKKQTGKGLSLSELRTGDAVAIGDEIEIQLSLTAKHAAEYIHLRDPRAAGFEPVSVESVQRWQTGISWFEEVRDTATNFFIEQLPAGEYTMKYRLRATTAGRFKSGPATLASVFAPEFAAYSAGWQYTVNEESRTTQ